MEKMFVVAESKDQESQELIGCLSKVESVAKYSFMIFPFLEGNI